MSLPITATIVARNEGGKISKCLASLKGVVDEIIFVHDGPCTDATLEIAKKYCARIFVMEYVGEAEPHRRFCWVQASNNWILQIDADEFLTNSLRDQLSALINVAGVVGYRFKWNIAFAGEKPNYDTKLALYRKDAIVEFLGIPHETVKLNGKIITLKNIELRHDRGSISDSRMKHKLAVWPQVHGSYTARYKYGWVPTILLPAGYLFYPLYSVAIHLLRGRIRNMQQAKNVILYAFRFWHAFTSARIKKLKNGRGAN